MFTTKIFDLQPGAIFRTKVMLLERSRILDSAHVKPTVSGMHRIKSTSSVLLPTFVKENLFLAHHTILVEKSAFKISSIKCFPKRALSLLMKL